MGGGVDDRHGVSVCVRASLSVSVCVCGGKGSRGVERWLY